MNRTDTRLPTAFIVGSFKSEDLVKNVLVGCVASIYDWVISAEIEEDMFNFIL